MLYTGDLTNGVYFIRVTGDNKQLSVKVVKQ